MPPPLLEGAAASVFLRAPRGTRGQRAALADPVVGSLVAPSPELLCRSSGEAPRQHAVAGRCGRRSGPRHAGSGAADGAAGRS